MDVPWLELALVGVLVLLNAAFAGSEIALISLREGQLQRLEEQRGATGRRLGALARDPNRFLATIQVGITLAGFLASAAAAVTLAEPLVGALSFLGRAAQPVAIVVVTTVLSFLTLVLGELAPKRIAMQRAERWGLLAARPLSLLAQLARPVIWLLSRSTDVVVRLTGNDPAATREDISSEELRDMVEAQAAFTPQQRAIIAGTFEVAERTLSKVLRPRHEVIYVDVGDRAPEAVDTLRQSGHTRAPAVRGDLDDVAGIVHLVDLVGSDGPAGDAVRPAPVLPETLNVLDALRRMQAGRQQMALVVNEHGVTEGIVTLEDLLEEIVGEIWDEFDKDVQPVRRGPAGSVELAGSFPVHDLADVGVDLPEGDYATVAGLVLDRLGHIPEVGESLSCEGWRIDVLAVERNAIRRLRLTPLRREGTVV